MNVLKLQLVALVGLFGLAGAQFAEAKPIEQSFMIRELQDAEESTDLFEIWQVEFDEDADVPLQIQVASFVELHGEFRVFIWRHIATTVTEVRRGVFTAKCNGRLNPFAGLDVVIEVRDGRILDISGSTRAGTKGQAVVAYKVDRKTSRVPIKLVNPSRTH